MARPCEPASGHSPLGAHICTRAGQQCVAADGLGRSPARCARLLPLAPAAERRYVSHTRGAEPAVFERVCTFPVHHAIGAFASDRDTCFFAARNTKLIALSATTGEHHWAAQIKNSHGWLAFDERRVFYLNQHACLVAL